MSYQLPYPTPNANTLEPSTNRANWMNYHTNPPDQVPIQTSVSGSTFTSATNISQLPSHQHPPEFRRAETLGLPSNHLQTRQSSISNACVGSTKHVSHSTLDVNRLTQRFSSPNFNITNQYSINTTHSSHNDTSSLYELPALKPLIYKSDSFQILDSNRPPPPTSMPKFQRNVSVPNLLPTWLRSGTDSDDIGDDFDSPSFPTHAVTPSHVSNPRKSTSNSPQDARNGCSGWSETSFNATPFSSVFDEHRSAYNFQQKNQLPTSMLLNEQYMGGFHDPNKPYRSIGPNPATFMNQHSQEQHYAHPSMLNSMQQQFSQPQQQIGQASRNFQNTKNHKLAPSLGKMTNSLNYNHQNAPGFEHLLFQQPTSGLPFALSNQQQQNNYSPPGIRHLYQHPECDYGSKQTQTQPMQIHGPGQQPETNLSNQFRDISSISRIDSGMIEHQVPGVHEPFSNHMYYPAKTTQLMQTDPSQQRAFLGYPGDAYHYPLNYSNPYHHFEPIAQPVPGLNFTMHERQVQGSVPPPIVPDPDAFAINRDLGPLTWAPTSNPIIRINNISWDVTIFDIQSYLYPLEIAHLGGLPLVHVLMIRETGKTRSDAYVEFDTMNDAMVALRERHRRVLRGRIVTIHRATQAELLRLTFPSFLGDFSNVDAVLDIKKSRSNVDYSPSSLLNTSYDPPKLDITHVSSDVKQVDDGPVPLPHGAASWNEAFAAFQSPVRAETVSPKAANKCPASNTPIQMTPPSNICGDQLSDTDSSILRPKSISGSPGLKNSSALDYGCFFITRTEINQCLAICKNFKLFFSRKCPQRPFETVIVILLKFPWHQKELLTTMQRDHLFELTKLAIEMLCGHLSKPSNTIDRTLLDRMLRAMLMVPAFTDKQKNIILEAGGKPSLETGLMTKPMLMPPDQRIDFEGKQADQSSDSAKRFDSEQGEDNVHRDLASKCGTGSTVTPKAGPISSDSSPPICQSMQQEATPEISETASSSSSSVKTYALPPAFMYQLGYFPSTKTEVPEFIRPTEVGVSNDRDSSSMFGSIGMESNGMMPHFVAVMLPSVPPLVPPAYSKHDST